MPNDKSSCRNTPGGEQHTPGPWRLVPPQEEYHKPVVQRGTEGGFGVHGLSKAREIADARLIAAAPDLLAALEAALKANIAPLPANLRSVGSEPVWAVNARAAIKKARGA